jgi:hypothetical protein
MVAHVRCEKAALNANSSAVPVSSSFFIFFPVEYRSIPIHLPGAAAQGARDPFELDFDPAYTSQIIQTPICFEAIPMLAMHKNNHLLALEQIPGQMLDLLRRTE